MKKSYYVLALFIGMLGFFYGIVQMKNYWDAQKTTGDQDPSEHEVFVRSVLDSKLSEATRKRFEAAVNDPLMQSKKVKVAFAVGSPETAPPPFEAMPESDPVPYAETLTPSQEHLRENTVKDFAVFREPAVHDPLSSENLETRERLVEMRQLRIQARNEAKRVKDEASY